MGVIGGVSYGLPGPLKLGELIDCNLILKS